MCFKYAIVTFNGNIVSRHKTERAAIREMTSQRANMRRIARFTTSDKAVIEAAGVDTFHHIINLTATEEVSE